MIMIEKDTSKDKIIELGQNCEKCGHCCSFGSGFIQVDELEELSKNLKITKDELKKKYLKQTEMYHKKVYKFKIKQKNELPYGKCIFLKNNICLIHDFKPLHCKIGTCNENGEHISEWYLSNYLVVPLDPESIRQWALRVSLHPTIKGANPHEIVKDKRRLKEYLNYETRFE